MPQIYYYKSSSYAITIVSTFTDMTEFHSRVAGSVKKVHSKYPAPGYDVVIMAVLNISTFLQQKQSFIYMQ